MLLPPGLALYLLVAMAVIVSAQRLVELRLAKRNQAVLLAKGAREFGRGHYPLFFVLHGAWFAGWITEGMVRGPVFSELWPLWAGCFVAAQLLRYWAVFSLGEFWNTRILIVPGAAPVKKGPYRYFRHPNYLAVVIEIASVPLFFESWITAAVASAVNAVILLAIRIPAEERALGMRR